MATPTRTLRVLGATFGDGSGSGGSGSGSAALEIPVFDLSALGLAAIPMTGGSGFVSVDTTEIWTALTKGPVTFVMPFTLGEATINMSSTVHGSTDGVDVFFCTATTCLDDITSANMNVQQDVFFANVNVYQEGVIMVNVTTLTGSIGAYIDEALGGEY